MALSKVSISVASGGLGRRAPNEDKISGLVFWNGTIPAGFASDKHQKVFTLAEAVALGIVDATNSEAEYYHVSEFFRLNPEGELWIQWNGSSLDPDFTELPIFQAASGGEIRQMGVISPAVFDGLEPTAIQAQLDLMPDDTPCSVLFTAEMQTLAVGGLFDLRLLSANKVTVVAIQDGGGQGDALATSLSISMCNVGAALGALSSASVEESIGWPDKFNTLSNGTEMEVLKYGTGELISTLTDTAQGAVKDDGYLVARKYTPNIAGSYWERVPTSIVATDDYAFIENVRVIDKAIRAVSAVLTPQLQRTLTVNADGTLTDDVIGYFQDLALNPLTDMQSNGEISDRAVLIDPTQDVNATSTLEITIQIVPVGIAEFITVTIGLTTSL